MKDVEQSFWLSRPDGWMINKKLKRIILLEFKRTLDASETYYTDMKKTADTKRTPILICRAEVGQGEGVVRVAENLRGQHSRECHSIG